jgi:hypothetical protein
MYFRTLCTTLFFRLQPQLYKPANGRRARGLVVLTSGPILHLIQDNRRQTYSHGRIAPGRWPTDPFLLVYLI